MLGCDWDDRMSWVSRVSKWPFFRTNGTKGTESLDCRQLATLARHDPGCLPRQFSRAVRFWPNNPYRGALKPIAYHWSAAPFGLGKHGFEKEPLSICEAGIVNRFFHRPDRAGVHDKKVTKF